MNLYNVKNFSAKYPYLTVGGLRYKLFKAHENGLAESGAIVRDGRRLLIDEDKFFVWYEKHLNSYKS